MSLSSWTLTSVLSDICLRAGLSYGSINLAKIEGEVEGFYMTSNNDAYTGIEALSQVYFFDVCNFDGKINFVPRGGYSVANITLDDLVDNGTDINKSTRYDTLMVPRVYNLEYYDMDGGLSSDKQTSDRSLDSRAKSEVRLETTVLMTADTAARLVVINHKIAIEEQRGGKEFSLPSKWIWLTVGDIVTFEGERLRINEIEIDDGFQNYKTSFDRKSAYVSTINGVPIQTASIPPTLIVGDTVTHFIDSRILRDSDDRLGYYVAIGGDSVAWKGALIELSLDGGVSYPENTTSTVDTVIGTITEVLPTSAVEYPDDRNVVTVELLQSYYSLSSVTFAEMLSRGNLALIGDEIINFMTATEVDTNIWELSYLLRGRKGSEVVQHEIGERFVLLDRSRIGFIDAELYQLNKDLTFRTTTAGATTNTVQTVTFTGMSQKERIPSYLRAVRSGGDIIATWQGVGKLGAGAYVSMGAYFTGYRVTINGVPQDTTAQTLTFTDPGGSVTISVQQINSITGVGDAATLVI